MCTEPHGPKPTAMHALGIFLEENKRGSPSGYLLNKSANTYLGYKKGNKEIKAIIHKLLAIKEDKF